MKLTGLLNEDLRDILWSRRMGECHFTGSKDMHTRFSPAAVSKSLTIGLDIFDVTPTHMCTL